MPSFRTAIVAAITSERDGLQRVELDDKSKAYCLTELVGPVAVGDRVVINTTAVDLDLGTGGGHVVHWNLSRQEWRSPGAGHVMKLRYTSVQTDTGVAEEHHAAALDAAASLGGRPVVVCSLHSQIAAVAAAIRFGRPTARLAYVMTDGGALPLALSDLVAALRAARLLDVTVTAGHAFGGEFEAVNVPSALLVAIAPQLGAADAVIVAMGPGGVGTGSRLGATALEVAPALDAAAVLGGRAIAAIRWSDSDRRPRHQGLSHHSRTALRLATHSALVPVPPGPYGAAVRESLASAGATHHVVEECEPPDVAALLDAAGINVTTMGRGAAEDPGFFAVAGAAGWAAAAVLSER